VSEIRVHVGNIRSRFMEAYPKKLVDAALSCYKKNYQFTTAFKQRKWDGKLHLLNPTAGTFPTGVLSMVDETLKTAGHTLKAFYLPDAVPLPVINSITKPFGSLTPREYQIEAVHRALQYQRGSLRLPTGAGKTLCAAMILHAFDVPGLVVIHGQYLVDQTCDKLRDYLGAGNIGLLMADDFRPGKFLVASIDTLALRVLNKDVRMLEVLRGTRVLIADEAHRVGGGARTFQRVMDACPASVRIGMSGTPLTKNEDVDLLLMSRTGPLLYDMAPASLQTQGYLAQAILTVYENREPAGLEHLTWREALTYLVAQNPARTRRVMDIAIDRARQGRRVLVIGGFSVRFVRELEKAFKETAPAGICAAFIARKDSKSSSYREIVNKAVEDFRQGRIQILCSTVIFDEGTDVPDLDVVLMAAPTKSFVRVMQRIGRGLRPKSGVLEVIDIADVTNRYLVNHFKARLRVYEEEKFFSKMFFAEGPVPSIVKTEELESYDEFDDTEGLWSEVSS